MSAPDEPVSPVAEAFLAQERAQAQDFQRAFEQRAAAGELVHLQVRLQEAQARGRAIDGGWASIVLEAAVARIRLFEKNLSPTDEVGARLANFGGTIVVTVRQVAFRDPHLVLLVGLDQEGRQVELLQHVSQLNLMLVAQPTADGSLARRIEFELPGSSTAK